MMSIEDQEMRYGAGQLEYHIIDDIHKGQAQLTDSSQQFKNQRMKHNFNGYYDDLQTAMYVSGSYAGLNQERHCNYCTGSLHNMPTGEIYFTHDDNCMFNHDGESENDEEYDECNHVGTGDKGAGGPYGDTDEVDIEGDREVEMLKRRLERFDQSRAMRKIRPNISIEWIGKLKEKLRIISISYG